MRSTGDVATRLRPALGGYERPRLLQLVLVDELSHHITITEVRPPPCNQPRQKVCCVPRRARPAARKLANACQHRPAPHQSRSLHVGERLPGLPARTPECLPERLIWAHFACAGWTPTAVSRAIEGVKSSLQVVSFVTTSAAKVKGEHGFGATVPCGQYHPAGQVPLHDALDSPRVAPKVVSGQDLHVIAPAPSLK